MHKKLSTLGNRQSLAEFTAKLSAKWRLGTQPTSPDTPPKNTEDILRELVAIPTVTGNRAANHEALEYIEAFLRGHGMHIRRFEWNGVESLVATTQKTKKPIIYLMGHIDVVPGPEQLFELRKKDGKYYGRGVLDMKAGIAAFLGAVHQLKGTLHEYDFGVMIVTDEEAGGFDGAEHLAEEGYHAQAMVIPDGGSNWNLERFAKGLWHVTLEASGRAAHGSRTWEGKNAIVALMDAVREIEKLFPTPAPENSSFNVGMFQGGQAINQVPDSASVSIDMRFSSLKDQQRIMASIRDIIAHHGLTLTDEILSEPMVSDPKHPLLSAYAASTEAVIGKKIEWITSNAGNDGRFFAPYGVQCAIAYPEGSGHHGLDEHISVESLGQLEEIITTYLQKVARKP